MGGWRGGKVQRGTRGEKPTTGCSKWKVWEIRKWNKREKGLKVPRCQWRRWKSGGAVGCGGRWAATGVDVVVHVSARLARAATGRAASQMRRGVGGGAQAGLCKTVARA